MDLTLVFAAVTGLDRMREQFDDATPRQQHTRRRPATQGHPRRRLWRRGLRTATDGAPTDADRRTAVPSWPTAAQRS